MSVSNCENGVAWILPQCASPLAGYPHMREVNGFYYVSGISARNPDGSVTGVAHVDGEVRTDVGAQTRAVIENIRRILRAAGADLDHLVAVTVYLVDMAEYADFNRVYNEFFTAQGGPSRTTVAVKALPGPHLRIEITAIAAVPRAKTPTTLAVPRVKTPTTLAEHLVPLADRLWDAERTRQPCAALTDTHPQLTVEDAYGIARYNLARGARRLIGRKIGLTSAAVQRWLNVDEPDFGGLTDAMAVADHGTVETAALLQPRVEGEIAFVLRHALDLASVTAADVLAATDYVLPAIEIIDSRVLDWKIKLADTVADNASSARFVLGGRPTPLSAVDLRHVGMALRKNGDVVSTGAGAACMDNPLNAVVWLANKLNALGDPLGAGDVILSGALGPVQTVAQGDLVEVDIHGLGTATVRFN